MKNKLKYLINPFLIIAIAAGLRMLPHPPNAAPIAAMALFGGAYLNKKYALIAPLLALFISDLFIGLYSLPMMVFVYGSFFLSGCVGISIKKNMNIKKVILASLFSSIIFYTITNFGVWLTGTSYPKSFAGLIDCYIAAIPFFRNTLIGDFIYTGIFFGGYEIILRFIKSKYKIIHLLQK